MLVSKQEVQRLIELQDCLLSFKIDRQVYYDEVRFLGCLKRLLMIFLPTRFDISPRFYFSRKSPTHEFSIWLGYFIYDDSSMRCLFSNSYYFYSWQGSKNKEVFDRLKNDVIRFVNGIAMDLIDINKPETFAVFYKP